MQSESFGLEPTPREEEDVEDILFPDDIPVDEEDRNTVPDWLLATLWEIWGERRDWFFGTTDVGIYDVRVQRSPLAIPDGFLSIGLKCYGYQRLCRISYVLQEEQNISPILALEIVSKTYKDEYGSKFDIYSQLGVKYYVILNPKYSQRRNRQPFEVYRLEGKEYKQQSGEPYWMEEVGLGIGRAYGEIEGKQWQWLAWYDREGNAYPLPLKRYRKQQQTQEESPDPTEGSDSSTTATTDSAEGSAGGPATAGPTA